MVKIKHISRVYTVVPSPSHSSPKIAPQNIQEDSADHELSLLKSGSFRRISFPRFSEIFPSFAIMGQMKAVRLNDPHIRTQAITSSLWPCFECFIFDIILLYNIGTTPTEYPQKHP